MNKKYTFDFRKKIEAVINIYIYDVKARKLYNIESLNFRKGSDSAKNKIALSILTKNRCNLKLYIEKYLIHF